MQAKSISGNSVAEIRQRFEEARATGFRPTLAIIFLSVSLDIGQVCEVFDAEGIQVFGATTHGEFTEGGISSGGAAILLLDLNPAYFTVLFSEFQGHNYRDTTQEIARKALQKFPHPAFLIAGSHLETDPEALLRGFQDVQGSEVNVFGGMAGDDFTFKSQFVFSQGQFSERGIVALVLDEEKLLIKGKATCGWKPMGTEKTVTRSEGNRVYTIENVSVLEMTRKYSGLENLTPDNPKISTEIATSFPLQLQREAGDPVMRPGLVVNWDDGSFLCSGSVPQGSKIRFSLPPDFDVVEKVIAGCKQMKEAEMPAADALVLFSCGGRLVSLGPMITEELEGVQQVWNVPMAGMFSNGELARATNGNLEMHNLTTCCVAIKEK
jgi:hypothetical protein